MLYLESGRVFIIGIRACEHAHTSGCVEGKSVREWGLGMPLEKGKMWKALCVFYIVF